jgi:predicted nuclease with TOPRIM domain
MITPAVNIMAVNVPENELEDILDKLKKQQEIIEKQDELIQGLEKEKALKDEKIKVLEIRVNLWKNKYNDYKEQSEIAIEKANKLINVQEKKIEEKNKFPLRLAAELIVLGFGTKWVLDEYVGAGN